MPVLNNIDPADLQRFIGTEQYHRNIGTRKQTENSYGGVHTDGAQHLCENGMAWFIDHVSLFHRNVQDYFQVWKITPDEQELGATITVDDVNGNIAQEFKLGYAEICCLNDEKSLKVLCVHGVIMLPSEY